LTGNDDFGVLKAIWHQREREGGRKEGVSDKIKITQKPSVFCKRKRYQNIGRKMHSAQKPRKVDVIRCKKWFPPTEDTERENLLKKSNFKYPQKYVKQKVTFNLF
jgi:hypothetical protein